MRVDQLGFTLWLFLITTLISAQPEQPNSASSGVGNFSKPSDIAPNLYNGAIAYPIPIGAVSQGGISVPYGLSYYTAGLRAHELSSSIGLGFSLQAGGVITRRIRGLADELEKGYINTGFQAQNPPNMANFIADVLAEKVDGEADIFSFNVGGLAGKFVFDHNGNIHTIPQSDLQITMTEIINDEVISFKILDANGTQYFFGPTNSNDPYANSEETELWSEWPISGPFATKLSEQITSWYLYKVLTPDNVHEINISYEDDHYGYFSLQDCSFSGSQTTCEMSAPVVIVGTKVVSSITSMIDTAYFDYTSDREDLLDLTSISSGFSKPKRLNKIRIVKGGTTVNVDLSQSYFSDNSANPIPAHLSIPSGVQDEVKKRLKLNEINITGGGLKIPPFKFQYYGQSANQTNGTFFPAHVTQAIDHHGFYNGKTNNNNQDHIIPVTTASNSCGSKTEGLAAVDRATSLDKMRAGSLYKITFPLGGSTYFNFGANSYWDDQDFMQTTDSSSVSNNDCVNYTQNTVSYTATISTQEFDHGTIYLDFDPLCTSTGSTTLEIKKGTNVVHSLTASGTAPDQAFLIIKMSSLQKNETYTFVLTTTRGKADSYIISSHNGTNVTCGGLRLEKSTTNDFNGNDKIREYEYTMHDATTKSSGSLFRTPKYGLFHATAGCTGFYVFSTNSTVQLQSFEGYHIGYSSVRIKHNGNGFKRNNFFNDFAPPPELDFPPIPENERSYVGQYKDSYTTDQSNNELASDRVQLDTLYNKDIGSQMIHVSPIGGGISKTYKIHSGIYVPDSTHNVLEGIKTSTGYLYNLGLQLSPVEITTHDETGTILSSKSIFFTTTYTGENSTDVMPYFQSKNIIAPFKENIYLNGKEVLEKTKHFKLFSGHARLSKSVSEARQFINGSWSSDISTTNFNTYDTKGNILSITPHLALVNNSYLYFANSMLKKSCVGLLCEQFEYKNNNTSSLLTKKTGIDNTFETFTHDGLHRLSTITDGETMAVTTITRHLSQTAKSYTKSISSFQADPLGLSQLTSLESRSFVNGLGQSIQNIQVGQGPNGKDLISAMAHDSEGRAYRSYETRESTLSTGAYVAPTGSWDYSETTFEASPFNRVLSTTPPSWHATTRGYGINTSSDLVKDLVNGGNYAAGSLFRKSVTDPNGHTSLSFTDVQGKLILSRRSNSTPSISDDLDTYFLHDIKNRQVEIIPPASTMGDSSLNYFYKYDAENKTIRNKIPSKGWKDYVFNSRDLVSAIRDNNLKAKNQWYAYNHDPYNREIKSGIHNSATAPTIDNPTLHNLLTQTDFGTSGIELGKPIKIQIRNLKTNAWLISEPHYDSDGKVEYVQSNNHLQLSFLDSTKYFYDGANNVVKLRSRIVDGASNVNVIENITHINSAGRHTAEWLNFNGQLRQLSAREYTEKDQVKTKYVGGNSTSHLQKEDFEYLKNGLLHKINDGTSSASDLYGYQINYDSLPTIGNSSDGSIQLQLNGNINSTQWSSADDLAQLNIYNYNDFDRLTHAYSSNNFYNSTYGYDKRGNFTTITRSGDVDGTATLIDSLDYNYLASNDNQMEKITESATGDRGYKSKGASLQYKYDANGNMTIDPHKGTTTVYNHLNLAETITWTNGRKIEFTHTADGSVLRQQDFDQGLNLIKTQDYLGQLEFIENLPYIVHHSEGRVINRGVEPHLKYLFLDHMQTVDGIFKANNIESVGMILEDQTDYKAADCIVFEAGFAVDDNAEFNASILPPPSYTPDWEYEWMVHDHLGNLRMVYNDQKQVIQRADYYPYGSRRMHYATSSLKSNYGYNGIEFVNDFGLGLNMATFRNLQSDIGIWHQVDLRAEGAYGFSPYNSAFGNPISYIDPEGDFPWVAVGVAAALQGFGGGVQASMNGDSFLGGFAKGAVIGGATSAATAGIGGFFGHGIGSFGTELGRAGAHGLIGGISSAANGSSFGSGFLGSAVSSGFASGLSGASGFLQYGGGAISGGLSNALSGGNFLIGAGQGLGIAALNHNGGCPPGVDCSSLMDIDVTISAQRNAFVGNASTAASAIGSISAGLGYSLAYGGNYRGISGRNYSIRNQGWNQYTGTRSHMNKMISHSALATKITRGLGAFNALGSTQQWSNGQINTTQYGIELGSTAVGTFAKNPYVSISWTIGYEGLGRQVYGRNFLGIRGRLRPYLRRNIWGIKD